MAGQGVVGVCLTGNCFGLRVRWAYWLCLRFDLSTSSELTLCERGLRVVYFKRIRAHNELPFHT